MIITRTPFRISFFGGGTDYPAWFRENGGAVLSTSIDKYCYITCRRLPPFFDHKHRLVYSRIENVRKPEEFAHPAARAVLGLEKEDLAGQAGGLEIHHDGDLPARSGLGSSSAFTVGLLHALSALKGRYVSKEELASRAIHIEQNVIGENVGSQDQISAAFGGMNRIDFLKNGDFRVAPLILPQERLGDLQNHLMLLFTRVQRIASDVAKSQLENMKNRRAELLKIREMVDEGIKILTGSSPIGAFGDLLHEAWVYKKTLSDRISTPEIDGIYEEARKAGALGGKILGAGGGGFLLLFAPPSRQEEILKRLPGLVHAPFKFENAGSKVVLYQPAGLAAA